MLKEFKAFVMRGNVVDMAVGIIIGAAFGKIVTSLVNDVMMPIVGLATGGIDFSQKFIDLTKGNHVSLAAAEAAGAAVVKYGVFINVVLDFLIVAFIIFMLIRAMNRLVKNEAAAPADPTTKACGDCLMEIPIKARRCGHCTSAVVA